MLMKGLVTPLVSTNSVNTGSVRCVSLRFQRQRLTFNGGERLTRKPKAPEKRPRGGFDPLRPIFEI